MGFSQTTLTMKLSLDSRYGQAMQRRAFFTELIEKLDQLPGVQNVGAVNVLPLSHSEFTARLIVEGYPNAKFQAAEVRSVTEHYLEAMGTPLIEGRFLGDADTANGPLVVLVNQRFAQVYYAHQDPLGRKVRLFGTDDRVPWRMIVGVVANVRYSSLEEEPEPTVYMPFSQSDTGVAAIAIRANLPYAQTVSSIREIVHAIDPALAVADISTMSERVSEANAGRRFQTFLLAVFAVVALSLASIGLYGLISYSVKQRTADIGIRLALGAQQSDVLRLVMGQGAKLILGGMVLGFSGVLVLTRVLSSLLYGIAPTDHFTLAAVSLVLTIVSLLACYIPARRATKADPMVALRHD